LDHPKVNGYPVSAGSPDILEQYAIGQIFNTKLDGKKLVAEMWINNTRVKELGEAAEKELERLQSSDALVEVSTGLFSMLEMNPGVYNGEKYERSEERRVGKEESARRRRCGQQGKCEESTG